MMEVTIWEILNKEDKMDLVICITAMVNHIMVIFLMIKEMVTVRKN